MTNLKPGSTYNESGKIEIVKFLIATLISVTICGVLGVISGKLSDINPLIYLNFLITIGSIIIIFLVSSFCIQFSHSRNKAANSLLVFISGTFFLYNSWVGVFSNSSFVNFFDGFTYGIKIGDIFSYISNSSMSISKLGRSNGLDIGGGIMSVFYFIEAIAFTIIPAALMYKNKTYYCEKCSTSMIEKKSYYPQTFPTFASIYSGEVPELDEQESLSEELLQTLETNLEITELIQNSCPNCGVTIIDINEGIIKTDDKGKKEYKEKSSKIQSTVLREKVLTV
jgi:hypothetical protein